MLKSITLVLINTVSSAYNNKNIFHISLTSSWLIMWTLITRVFKHCCFVSYANDKRSKYIVLLIFFSIINQQFLAHHAAFFQGILFHQCKRSLEKLFFVFCIYGSFSASVCSLLMFSISYAVYLPHQICPKAMACFRKPWLVARSPGVGQIIGVLSILTHKTYSQSLSIFEVILLL